MSTFPFAIRGGRSDDALRNMNTLKKFWDKLWEDPNVTIRDCMEEGLCDPVTKTNMAETAEICAQEYGIDRREQDEYTLETFKRCINAHKGGFYKDHLVPVKDNGNVLLDKDEYCFLREKILKNPKPLFKAPFLFENSQIKFRDFMEKFKQFMPHAPNDPEKTKPTLTLFNACPRSDGAAAVIVTSEERAKELGLEIFAEVKGWAYAGHSPARMGITPAFAVRKVLKETGIKESQLDNIEIHEAFAATVLSIFEILEKEDKFDWRRRWQQGTINPHGGSIPMGHPLAATGTRLLLNLMYAMAQNPDSRYGMVTACAAGGLGGAMVLEKYRN